MRTQALFGMVAVALRAATLIFQSLVIGGVVFHRWIAPRILQRSEGQPGITLLRLSALALAGTQLLFVGFNTAILMQGMQLSFRDALTANYFVVGVITIVASLFIASACSRQFGNPSNVVVAGSMAVLVCGVIGSHAASRLDNRAFLATCTAVHQGAAAVWIGGLPQLWMSLRNSDPGMKVQTSRRFSGFALGSVIALLISGLAMSFEYIDKPSAIYGTSYGLMLAVKLAFFAVLLGIGACNRMLIKSADPAGANLLMRSLLEAEIGIGITAILAAASLTSQPPAIDLTAGRVTAQEIYQRIRPAWPRFGSPELSEVSASTLQADKQAQRAGLPPPPTHANTLADIGWSEYNHHWAGVFVLLMGLMGMWAQLRGSRRMRYWPLMMIGLAAFIFLRADPEGWPLGPDSFWESIQEGEVMQHKAFALLIVLFAVFELRVQLGKASARAAYVFPAVCALGGALLLTHSHALNNIKEQLLAELSHAPIAIAAVMAGWSRWLQLRLPTHEGKFASRIWPVCFVAIGAILLNYREA